MNLMPFWIVLSVMLGAAGPLWLYLKLRAEVRTTAAAAVSREHFSEKTGALAGRLAALEGRLEELDRTKEEHAEWLSQAGNLNLNRRGQVLRLHRRGDSVQEIASALRMRPGEVSLMIKVYEISRNFSGSDFEKI